MDDQLTARAVFGGVLGCSFGAGVMTLLAFANPSWLTAFGSIVFVLLDCAMCVAAWRWWQTF